MSDPIAWILDPSRPLEGLSAIVSSLRERLQSWFQNGGDIEYLYKRYQPAILPDQLCAFSVRSPCQHSDKLALLGSGYGLLI